MTQPLAAYDWETLGQSLAAQGNAVLPGLLDAEECAALRTLYPQAAHFRKRIIMARYGFGRGEYQYFNYPLPALIQGLRHALYPRLAAIANHWNQLLDIETRYPENLATFLQQCHAAGQTRPTPLILRYEAGDYNCLHQDLYGQQVFPLQATVLLSEPARDFQGGEFVMTELSARHQRVDVVPLNQGDAVIFTVNQRPVPGRRGMRRVTMRHGVSRIRQGERYTVGIIFHDAQ